MIRRFLVILILLTSLIGLPPTAKAQSTILSITPPLVSGLSLGDFFSVNLTVTDVNDLDGWQAMIVFDSAVLYVTDALYPAPGESQFCVDPTPPCYDIARPPTIDNSQGSVVFAATFITIPSAGPSGSGTLATIFFEILCASCSSIIGFAPPDPISGDDPTKLRSVVSGQIIPIPHDRVGGFFTNLAQNPPIASFTVSPEPPEEINDTITLDASDSYDPDGVVVLYIWDFGDGTGRNTTTPVTTHAYETSGTFTISLNVMDDDGLVSITVTMFYAILPAPSPPPEHELEAGLQAPPEVSLGSSVILLAQVVNRGTSYETNVLFELAIDGTVVESLLIPSLGPNGTSAQLSFVWTPNATGTFQVTASVDPVPGEQNTSNNIAGGTVLVRMSLGIIGIDQGHSNYPSGRYLTLTNTLVSRGYSITTLSSINSQSLSSLRVLIIPEAHIPFTQQEITNVQNFVTSGGGLLVIGDDASSIYDSLTSFSGINWIQTLGITGTTTSISSHPVTLGVSSVYFDSPISILQVSGGAQGVVRDTGGNIMVAVSELGGRVVAVTDEATFDEIAINVADNLVLGNNIVDWLAHGQIMPHELVASLSVLDFLLLGNSTTITATVSNLGSEQETDVQLQLFIDGTVVDEITIPILNPGSQGQLSFQWNPSSAGLFNVTAYVPPVAGENTTANNRATVIVTVMELVVNIDPRGDTFGGPPSLDIASIDARYDGRQVTITFVFYTPIAPGSANQPSSIAGAVDIDIDQDPTTGATAFSDIYGRPPPSGLGVEYYISLFEERFNPGRVAIIDALGGRLIGTAPVTFTSHSLTMTIPLSMFGGDGLFNFGTVIGTLFFPTDEAPNQCCATSERIPEHNLAVASIDALPTSATIGQIIAFEVTIRNTGTFTETFDVNIMVNGTVIGTITGVTLAPETNVTLTFEWNTSTSVIGAYIVSATVTVVPGETDIADNLLVDGRVRLLPKRLTLTIEGDFDYLIRENVRVRISALVLDAFTAETVSGANVLIQIYDDNNKLIVSALMTETLPGSGVYEWRSTATINRLALPKGVYLVRAQASWHNGPIAYGIVLFHIDPPSEQAPAPSSEQPLSGPWVVAGTVIGSLLGGVGLAFLLHRGVKRRLEGVDRGSPPITS